MSKEQSKQKHRGGRPTRAEAGQLEDKILDAAAALFFAEGYGAVRVDAIARRAQISKRTFYARYENKAAIFSAVVHRIVRRLRPAPAVVDKLFAGDDVEQLLRRLTPVILRASLTPDALALQRIVLAEATRFPELVAIMSEQGSRQEAIRRIADLLRRGGIQSGIDPFFAAEQFLLMVTSGPQRRALGLGQPLTANELDVWAVNSVDLFLKGCPFAKTP